MMFSEEQVEWIVVEVIQRLRLLEASNQPLAAAECSSNTADASKELQINDPLITLNTINGRLGGVSRLAVSKKAVVTPAVWDELKKHKIELVREKGS
jgi:hypothetical protein